MKNKFAIVLIGFLSLVACKKSVTPVNSTSGTVNIVAESAVPATVLSSFNSSFSTATEREWQHNSADDSFACQFNMDNQRHEAHFDDKGHESEHSVICINASIPAGVLTAFRNSYPSDNVYEWNLTSDNTWKAHFMRGSVKWEVTFDAAGTMIKSEHS